jgi:hypothetical protein
MAASKRVKREAPTQSGPNRNGAGSVSSETQRDRGPAPSVSSVVERGLKTALLAVEASNATVLGTVERGVDTAYMVIEEYMQRGREAAGRRHERGNGRADMDANRKNEGPWGGQYPWGPMTPMVAPWMQMMRMWTDSMAAFLPGGPAMATQWMNQFTPGGAMWPGMAMGPRPHVVVRIDSQQPAEVAVDIDPGAECMGLTANALVAAGADTAPPLAGVSIDWNAGEARVSITVPNDQPAGTYSGTIVDSTGVRRGGVRVKLEAKTKATSPAK